VHLTFIFQVKYVMIYRVQVSLFHEKSQFSKLTTSLPTLFVQVQYFLMNQLVFVCLEDYYADTTSLTRVKPKSSYQSNLFFHLEKIMSADTSSSSCNSLVQIAQFSFAHIGFYFAFCMEDGLMICVSGY